MSAEDLAAAYLRGILSTHVYDVAVRTPTTPMPLLSKRLGLAIELKREDLQPVFSFKIRGAFNKIAKLDPIRRQRGVICASAGNHAQGVAVAARHFGIRGVIVMPVTTPEIKVEAVRRLGGEVVLHGNQFDTANTFAQQKAIEDDLCFIPPYDDADVITGQGTVALELLQQCNAKAVFVPVGGGGLLAGITACLKAVHPHIKVYGVEPEDAACLTAAMREGKPVTLAETGNFVDGASVAKIGEEPFRVVQGLIDGVVTVESDEVCAAIKDIYEDCRAIAEPAGALALAGLKKAVRAGWVTEEPCVAILSGANVNFHRLRHISERTELGEMREAVLSVRIPEVPGSFQKFCDALGQHNITEFNYRFADPNWAHVYVGVTTSGDPHCGQQLVERLQSQGYEAEDLSKNEIAKLHIRYMVGGPSAQAGSEAVVSFQFPERPGALLRFLQAMGGRWNISLFHYRNHGQAQGRVLAGFQVAGHEMATFTEFLDDVGYPWQDETQNPAYKRFLANQDREALAATQA
jgi:threonine dehydratase